MSNYRSVLSGEHEAALAVHETLLPAYEAALDKAQFGLEFSIEENKISVFGNQETDLITDLFNSLETAVAPYANDDLLEIAWKLRTGDIGPSAESFFQGILEFHEDLDGQCPAFALLVACGIAEPLRLEQIGYEKCQYVTYSNDNFVPIEDYLRTEPAPLEPDLKYPIELFPALLRNDLQILISLWNKYRVTHSEEFANQVKTHMIGLLFNVGWMLNQPRSSNTHDEIRERENWVVLHYALNCIDAKIEVVFRSREDGLERNIDGLFAATVDTEQVLACLWEEFDQIFVNQDETIDEDFLHFPKGSHREVVLKWFDDHHSKGVAWLTGPSPIQL